MSMKILTVDDSRTMRDMLRLALTGAGFDVVQAVDGVDGLDVLERETPDLVITDINMPKMDGFGFIEGARKIDRFRVVPILVLTTESDPDKKMRAKNAGRDGLDRQAVRPGQARRRHPSRGRLTPRSGARSWIRCRRSEIRSSRNARSNSANSRPGSWRWRTARPTRKPSTRYSARCIPSRAAPARSSSTSWSSSRTCSRPRSTRSAPARSPPRRR